MMLPDDRYSELVRRYQQFHGRVAADQNQPIPDLLSGEALLEVGCGDGQVGSQASKQFRVVGAGYDLKALQSGKKEFETNLVLSDSCLLGYADDSFDAVILQETARNLDRRPILPEPRRIARKKIVIFYPNQTMIMRLGRRLIGHRDYEHRLPELLRILDEFRYEVIHVAYRDVIAFPASRGLVGIRLVHPVEWMERLVWSVVHAVYALLLTLYLQQFFPGHICSLLKSKPRQNWRTDCSS